MAETIGNRISRLVNEMGMTPEQLSSISGINLFRIRRFLAGFSPEDEEIPSLAQALGIYVVEIKNDLAGRFGRFLRANEDYWSFPMLWPNVESRTGLRGRDIDEPEKDHQLFAEVLEEYQKDQIWYNYGPPPPFYLG